MARLPRPVLPASSARAAPARPATLRTCCRLRPGVLRFRHRTGDLRRTLGRRPALRGAARRHDAAPAPRCMRLDNATRLPPCCNSPPAPGCCNATAPWGRMLHPLPNERRCRCERLLHRPKARAAPAAHSPLHVLLLHVLLLHRLLLHRLLSQLRLSGERCTAACCTRHRRAAVAATATRRTGAAVAGAVDQLTEQVDAVRLRASPPRTHEQLAEPVHQVGIDQGLGEDRSGCDRVLLTQPAEVDVLDRGARRLPRQIRRFALGGLTVPAPRGTVHRRTVAAGAESLAHESGTRPSPIGAHSLTSHLRRRTPARGEDHRVSRSLSR